MAVGSQDHDKRIGFDHIDPTLIAKARTPLTPHSLIQLAAAAGLRPEHTVHIEGDWLVLRLPEES